MNKGKSLLLNFSSFFILINLLIIIFLLIDVPETQFSLKSITNIILRFGLKFSIPIALFLVGADYFYFKIAKNIFLKIHTIVAVLVVLYFVYLFFLWNVGIVGLVDGPFVN